MSIDTPKVEIVPSSTAALAKDASGQVNYQAETTSMTGAEQLMHDIEGILHAPRPGATKKEINKHALKQLELLLKNFLSEQYGISAELLKSKSLEQLASDMLKVGHAAQDIITESKKGAHHIASIQHIFAEPRTNNEWDEKQTQIRKSKRPRAEKKRDKTRGRRAAQASIHQALEELENRQNLFTASSNNLVTLDNQSYSLHHILGHYLGAELRAILTSVTARQHGDDTSICAQDLADRKRTELADSFVAAAPGDFFQVLLCRLGLESIIPKFMEARNKLVNGNFRSLKDSFNNSSGEAPNWNKVMTALLKELELKTKSTRDPQLVTKQKTRGFSPSFISKIKSFWRDRDAAIYGASTVA